MTPHEQIKSMTRPDLYDPSNNMDVITFMKALQDVGYLFTNEILRQVFEEWKGIREQR